MQVVCFGSSPGRGTCATSGFIIIYFVPVQLHCWVVYYMPDASAQTWWRGSAQGQDLLSVRKLKARPITKKNMQVHVLLAIISSSEVRFHGFYLHFMNVIASFPRSTLKKPSCCAPSKGSLMSPATLMPRCSWSTNLKRLELSTPWWPNISLLLMLSWVQQKKEVHLQAT